ncbi:streptomycin phosphotransferase [Janthinobacterium sp. Marseille]|nr:aminoglycoside phosphotransferase family protein [Janthinobacterium sp. Marseille]ABR89742.1 streptomycin phosphotransferase [Janthinobacterium sp. Marseille]
MLEPYLKRWQLTPDGTAIMTPGSQLLPVRMAGMPAMLKVSAEEEEKNGALLLAWWDGDAAARVLACEGDALLMERAEGQSTLLEMALHGRDDEASRIMCKVTAQLHAPRNKALPPLVPLTQWFQALEPAAAKYGGIFTYSAAVARDLLAKPQNTVVLHGDIHHGNILDFGARGWLAIDPKGLAGERGFDYANIFCNPELANAIVPARFLRQLEIVVANSGLERTRLLQWILAYAGLSAAWFFEDGMEAPTALAVAELAISELNR